ncbi:MAG: trigger factor [Planctomycetaceae bacterium]|jgi:trigger factor|nr:trigger factor [Planctomycetaceae bacterium]
MSEETIDTLQLTTDIQKVSSCERRVKVTVPRPEIDRYFQKEFTDLEKTAYVPGFRSGKAPRSLVEKRFKKDASERVRYSLVFDALSQVNNSDELTPISEPDFDFNALTLPNDGPFVFEFNIEVRPEIDLPEWKGLKIEKKTREFSAEDVDKAVERVLTSYGDLEPKEEPAQSGDYIVAKLTFQDGGTVLSQSESETIRIRSVLSFRDGSVKEFDKLMSGAKAGDVITSKVVLTKDAANEAYRGKAIDVHFSIIAVKKLVVPPLSKDFLERLGGFDNVGDFRDAVLDTLQRQLEYEQRRHTRQQITEKLTAAAGWDLPPGLLKRQSEREFRRQVLELQRSGYSNEDVLAHQNYIRQNIAAETARALKEHFILEKIADVEKVEDTEEDYNTEVALIAAQSGVSPRRIRAKLEKEGDMDILRNQIIERKVIDLIYQHASFTEVPFEFENLDEEGLDWAAAGDPNAIQQASEDDLKAVHQEFEEKKKIDPNTKVK